MAGTHSPCVEQGGRGGHRVGLGADDHRQDRRRVVVAPIASATRSTCLAAGRRRPSPSAERTTPRAARAAAASAGVGAVVKMYGRARLTSSSTKRGRSGHEPAERPERLGQRAHPQDVDPVGASASSGPRTAWASSSTRSAPWRRATVDQAVEVGHVAVHGEDGVGDDDRPARPGGQRRRRGRQVAVGIDAHVGPGQPAAVDDRGVVELVGVDDHSGAAKTDRTDRLAANPVGKRTARLGALPVGERRLELVVDRAGAGDQPGRACAGAPAVEGPWAAATTAGWVVRPR